MAVTLKRPLMPDERRSPERVRAHYDVERELAERLRRASAADRPRVYGEVYDELFRRVPDHPQITKPLDAESRARDVQQQVAAFERWLSPRTVFLEIGTGDCALSAAVAPRVHRVVAVDVSSAIAGGRTLPANLEVRITDGTHMPVEPGSITLAYSNQLMEHLHPDDATAQLDSIVGALAPGGQYLCVTPHPFMGPHDISYYFDDEATGFHLLEYTVGGLTRAFRRAGFRRVTALVGARGRFVHVPVEPILAVESLLAGLPRAIRNRVASAFPVRLLFGFRLIGWK